MSAEIPVSPKNPVPMKPTERALAAVTAWEMTPLGTSGLVGFLAGEITEAVNEKLDVVDQRMKTEIETLEQSGDINNPTVISRLRGLDLMRRMVRSLKEPTTALDAAKDCVAREINAAIDLARDTKEVYMKDNS